MWQAPTWLKNELKEGIALDNGEQEDTQDDSGSEEADSETEETDNGKTRGILGRVLVGLNAREPSFTILCCCVISLELVSQAWETVKTDSV